MSLLPRDISAAAARRRRLLADLSIAIGIALVASLLAAGVSVLAFVALPTLLLLLSWFAIEAAIRRVRLNRRQRPRSAASRA